MSARILAQSGLGAQLFPELSYVSHASLHVAAGKSIVTVMDRMASDDVMQNEWEYDGLQSGED